MATLWIPAERTLRTQVSDQRDGQTSPDESHLSGDGRGEGRGNGLAPVLVDIARLCHHTNPGGPAVSDSTPGLTDDELDRS